MLRAVHGLEHVASGKVRELYRLDDDRLVIVATDRISAFDVVLEPAIPDKGRVLTGLSLHWFDVLETPHHLLTADVAEIPGLDDATRRAWAGRAMVVRRAEVIPMECVVRGYLYGSSWREYAAGGGPTTEHLPPGLEEASELPEPIFTPATKAADGHDENLTEAQARALVGDERYEELRRRSIDLYLRGRAYAADRGILLADTKFEFGVVDGELVLVDEVLTPDSSRYWPAEAWKPGGTVPSFDKQPVRDWLAARDWDRRPPAPRLPDEVVADTRRRYVEAYERLVGEPFEAYLTRMGVR
ncbi:MAG TPA: phosphoribosylaminoimidazolesuccinocarboxamide synthase [Actinobacteria bacterium]|nr:phosphoribosylaminoimidazolesuccinocarboxamide synthase [Actinomycetota bacterium]